MNLGISTLVTLLALAVPAAVSAETWREQSEATEDARELKGWWSRTRAAWSASGAARPTRSTSRRSRSVRGEDERHASPLGARRPRS